MAVTPYLFFSGTGREAYNFYCDVFEVPPAERDKFMTFGQAPGEHGNPEDAERIINAYVPLPGGGELMLSDTPSDYPAIKVGDNISIATDFADLAQQQRAFAKLADGGKVSMPLQQTFFAESYGNVTDKFGTIWQLTHGIRMGME